MMEYNNIHAGEDKDELFVVFALFSGLLNVVFIVSTFVQSRIFTESMAFITVLFFGSFLLVLFRWRTYQWRFSKLEIEPERITIVYGKKKRVIAFSEVKKVRLMMLTVPKYNYSLSNDLVEGKSAIGAGIVLAPKCIDERIRSIKAKMVPLVVIGRAEVGQSCCCVDVDNFGLVRQITEILIRKYGHRKILLVNSKRDLTITEDRENGFLAAVNEASVRPWAGIAYVETETEEAGYEAVKQIFSQKHYTAILVSSDQTCFGVYRALKERGLEIGKQVSVFALGGERLRDKRFSPPVSYAHQDYRIIGQTALKLLDDLTEGRSTPPKTYVKSEVFFSDSCGHALEDGV